LLVFRKANCPTQLLNMTLDINVNKLADAFPRTLAMHTMPNVQEQDRRKLNSKVIKFIFIG